FMGPRSNSSAEDGHAIHRTKAEEQTHDRARLLEQELRVPIAPVTAGADETAVGRAAPARPALPQAPRAEAVRRELERVFASADFDATRRSREFLRFVVEEALANRGGDISQAAIAVQVFGRRPDFDGGIDPIVRIQAGRLRRSLERYY